MIYWLAIDYWSFARKPETIGPVSVQEVRFRLPAGLSRIRMHPLFGIALQVSAMLFFSMHRSAIYTFDDAHQAQAERSRDAYQQALGAAGYGEITTEVAPASQVYYAEHYHQQYLAKVPGGYCGIAGTGVGCQVEGLVRSA